MFVEFWFPTPPTQYLSTDVVLTCEAKSLCCFKILLLRIARQEERRAISGPTLLYLALGLTEISDESLHLDMTNIERRLITETSKFYTKYSHTLIQIWWQRVTFRLYPKQLTLSASVPLDTVHTTVHHIYFYIFHTQTHHTAELLWTSDWPVAETSTSQHTILMNRQVSMPPAGFEPAVPTSEQHQTDA